MRMKIAEYIKECVTMADICRQYGFSPDRAGFISCPFHREKTASLKIFPDKRGWHCFGCGAGGSVIDFVERLFGVGFNDAANAINRDFNLGLSTSAKMNYREREMLRRKVSQAEMKRAREQAERDRIKAEYEYWLNEYVCAELIINALRPKGPEEEFDDNYVHAMHMMPVTEHNLDCLMGVI